MSMLKVVLSTILVLCVVGAPRNTDLTEAKDELLLADAQQTHKEEDLQSASESQDPTKAPGESETHGNATSSEGIARDAQDASPTNGEESSAEDDSSAYHLLHEFMNYNASNSTDESGYKVKYDVDDGKLKKFRYEERTPEGAIIGEFGYHKNGVIRGVRYAAEPGVHPKLVYEALVKFFSL